MNNHRKFLLTPPPLIKGRRRYLLKTEDALPLGYTRLEYLESDGSQYIDTGFKPNNNTRVIFEGYNNSASSGWIFGAWKDINSQMFCASALSTYNICYGTEIWTNATMPVGPISIDINKNAYTYNGVSGTLSEQAFSCDYTMYLFHINAAERVSTGSFNGRIYSVKIYDNGVMIRNFIPATNLNGEEGLYDTINNTWYGLKDVLKTNYFYIDYTTFYSEYDLGEYEEGEDWTITFTYPTNSALTLNFDGTGHSGSCRNSSSGTATASIPKGVSTKYIGNDYYYYFGGWYDYDRGLEYCSSKHCYFSSVSPAQDSVYKYVYAGKRNKTNN